MYIKFSNFHLEYPIFLCTFLLLMQRSSLRLSSYIFVGNKISTPSTNLSSYLKKSRQKNKKLWEKIEIFRSDIFANFTLFLVWIIFCEWKYWQLGCTPQVLNPFRNILRCIFWDIYKNYNISTKRKEGRFDWFQICF